MAMNLDSMRARLETKRSELRKTIAELRTLYSASTSSSGTPEEAEDLEDAAREIVEREEEQSIFENQQVLLSEIEQALKRLDEGTYGQCCQCGLPIPEKRLEAANM